MSKLTPKQENFCREYIKTGNKSEAYRLSYSTKNWTENSINVEASKLSNTPKVLLRIEKLQEAVAKRHNIDIDWCIVKLKAVVEDDDKDRVIAIDKLMKHLGGYAPDKLETTSTINIIDLGKGIKPDETTT